MGNHKEKSRTSFDKQAKIYDNSNYSRIPRESYPYVLDELSKIKFNSILDLGCGTGSVLSMLLEKKLDIQAYGLDLSNEMLKEAKGKLGERAKLLQGDAEHLPYDENSFDLVMCTESFHHYPNPLKALQEIHRVLKPQGKFLLCDIWRFAPVRQILNVFIRFGDDGDVRIYSEKEIISMFKKLNFNNINWKKASKNTYICAGEKA